MPALATNVAAAPDDEPAGSKTLLTVLSNGDGTYQLVSGDEPEPEEMPPGPGPGAGMGEAAGASQGETYDSPGALLKAILDIVRADMDASSGEGSAESNFQAGFAGTDTAGPGGKTPMAQKY